MTNGELNLQKAVEKLNNGELNSYESEFISQFEGHSKKDLKNITHAQFCKIREIANK